jgi:hypothetical protein
LANKNKGKEPTGFRLFCAYRKFLKLPEYPTDVEFEEDNLQMYFINLVLWASSRIIPYGFDIDLMLPANKTVHRAVMPATVASYISASLQHLRRLFPEHEEFINLDPNDDQAAPEWWSPLSNACVEMCGKLMTISPGDYTFGTGDIHPLYTDLRGEADLDLDADFDDGNTDIDPLRVCDLQSVVTNLLRRSTKNNNNMEKLAWVLSTQNAIGRGGRSSFNPSMTGHLITVCRFWIQNGESRKKLR